MSNLQEAFREAAGREFAMVPDETELDYIFSRKFERKMRRIIRAQVHGYWMMVNTAAKRVAVAVAIIVMLLTSVMAIKPIRERVIKFFVDMYEEHFEIHFGEEESWDLPERTEPMVRYTLTELPTGYYEVNILELRALIWTDWMNEEGKGISLKQEPGTQEITLDITNAQQRIVIGEIEIAHYQYDSSETFVWEQYGYIFYLSIHDKLPIEQIMVMISSITIA